MGEIEENWQNAKFYCSEIKLIYSRFPKDIECFTLPGRCNPSRIFWFFSVARGSVNLGDNAILLPIGRTKTWQVISDCIVCWGGGGNWGANVHNRHQNLCVGSSGTHNLTARKWWFDSNLPHDHWLLLTKTAQPRSIHSRENQNALKSAQGACPPKNQLCQVPRNPGKL